LVGAVESAVTVNGLFEESAPALLVEWTFFVPGSAAPAV
jgi:hypothetical protein